MYKSIDRQWLIEIKCLIIFTHKLDQNKKWYCNVSNHHIFGVSEYPQKHSSNFFNQRITAAHRDVLRAQRGTDNKICKRRNDTPA